MKNRIHRFQNIKAIKILKYIMYLIQDFDFDFV